MLDIFQNDHFYLLIYDDDVLVLHLILLHILAF